MYFISISYRILKSIIYLGRLDFGHLLLYCLSLQLRLHGGGLQMAVYLLDPFDDGYSVRKILQFTGLWRWSMTRYLGFLWLQLDLLVELVLKCTQLGTI